MKAKTMTLSGDSQLWLVGDSSLDTASAIAISSTGTLTIGGPGSLALDVLDDEPCEGKAEDRRRVCDCAVYACL